ncbi:MAG: response regulator, partial [Gallionellaceae bacterium]|nr:response regulator [Gallionellaceae bacterium]
EIRTPMNAIIGFTHLCLQTKLEPSQHDYLDKVYKSANSLLGIINDILDFSKIESGKLEVEKVPFRLDEVMSGVAFVNSIRAEEKGLEFLLDMDRNIPKALQGDALRLHQVLNNLVSNAIKFTHAGEIMIRIEETSRSAHNIKLRFSVSDSGIGMSEEQIGKLFQSFSQADASTSRKYGGTGLGLAISKQLVDLMGGRIWVDSAPGQGSHFIFELPFVLGAEESHTLPDLNEYKVLVVDDNESARKLEVNYLNSFNISAASAASGSEAEALISAADAAQQPYTDILLDWSLPDIGSIDVAQHIKQTLPLSRRPRIIYLNGHTQNQMLKETAQGKLLDVVVNKPVTASRLYDALMDSHAGRGNLPEKLTQAATRIDLGGLHVLLVEDNEINRQLASVLLNRAGVTISIAEDGVQALQAVERERFDAVLMDMQMPNMDGLEATRAIRKIPALATLPIIAMTANAMFGDRERCLEAGMDDYITKPINFEKMYSVLARRTGRAEADGPPPAIQPSVVVDSLSLDTEKAIAAMGSEEIYLIVLEKFISNQGKAVQSIADALAVADGKTAARLAHTLKGLAATIGADALAELVRQLEWVIPQGDAQQSVQLLASTEAEMQGVLEAVAAYRKAREVVSAPQQNADTSAALVPLLEQLNSQLLAFDSEASNTMRQIKSLLNGSEVWQRFKQLDRHINEYDYEKAQAEMQHVVKE